MSERTHLIGTKRRAAIREREVCVCVAYVPRILNGLLHVALPVCVRCSVGATIARVERATRKRVSEHVCSSSWATLITLFQSAQVVTGAVERSCTERVGALEAGMVISPSAQVHVTEYYIIGHDRSPARATRERERERSLELHRTLRCHIGLELNRPRAVRPGRGRVGRAGERGGRRAQGHLFVRGGRPVKGGGLGQRRVRGGLKDHAVREEGVGLDRARGWRDQHRAGQREEEVDAGWGHY